jgi:hypothetical protein
LAESKDSDFLICCKKSPNKDVLNVKSSKISNYNLLQDYKGLFEDLRNGGFREINFTESSGETRNVNLEVLDK